MTDQPEDTFDIEAAAGLRKLGAADPLAVERVQRTIADLPARQGRSSNRRLFSARWFGGLAAAIASVLVVAMTVQILGMRPAGPFGPIIPPTMPGSAVAPSESSKSSAPATASIGPNASLVQGPDGIPTQMNGQRVYRIEDRAEWPKGSNSFLLAVDPWVNSPMCGPRPFPSPSFTAAEQHLIWGSCFSVQLSSLTGYSPSGLLVAPKSSSLDVLSSWDGEPVVLRVHTHDPETALCSAGRRAQCDAAVVVEDLLWPTIPAEIDGAHVYRGNELVSMGAASLKALNGSILVGGVVHIETAQIAASCATYPSNAEQQLLWACRPDVWLDDGAQVAPAGNFDVIAGQLVVVRGHVNDALAAQCPTDTRQACEQAIVVESVVWSSGPYPLATPVAVVTHTPPAVGRHIS